MGKEEKVYYDEQGNPLPTWEQGFWDCCIDEESTKICKYFISFKIFYKCILN